MDDRLCKLYEDIEVVEDNMAQIQTRLDNIRQQKISGDNVYQFLLYFDLLYDKFTNSEKKEFLQSFVERVELFPEKQPDGRFLKRIKFRFPVYFDGAEVDGMRWDNETTVETVCLLSKLQAKQHIEIDLNMDELDLTDAEKKATYQEIKDYVLEHSGLKVSSLYIAQVKQKCGIIERENYNKPKSEDAKQPQCPLDKEKAIKEALQHFGMI